jgi:RNA polymerase sigma factor (sigma-70 family)
VSPTSPPPFDRFLEAEREVVWRYLLATVGRADADDCFQETFVAALRAYPRLRAGSDLRAWVLTIAHRKAIDALRARTRGAQTVADVAELAPNPSGARGASPERDGELWEAVGALPARQRSAIVLRYVGDLAHREIASAIGCSEDAARRSLHEGLNKLRKAVAA